MQELQVGFLGAGWIAQQHAKAVHTVPGAKVAAICNRHVERARDLNDKHLAGAARCYSDFAAMLDSEKLDVLYVCLPPGAHNGEVEAAANRGIHLALEKPIALTMEGAGSMAAAIKKAGVKCQIGFNMRHYAPVRELKRMLDDGSAGRPLMMHGRFFLNGTFPGWWRDPAMGGGQLIEQAIHLYDMARHLLGEPRTVTAFVDNLAHRRFPDYRVDDVSAAMIRFRNGAIADICACNFAEPAAGFCDFTVMCEKVMVVFRSGEDATFIDHGGKMPHELKPDEIPVPHREIKSTVNKYELQAKDFVAAIRENEPLRSTIDDGVESLRLVLAAAKSASLEGAPQSL